MNKTQIIISVSAVIVAILIFQLPKAVVENEETRQSEAATEAPENTVSDHVAELSEESTARINELKKQLNTVSDPEKKVIFADSLSELFRKNQLFDSAAIYFEKVAELDPDKENLIQAGELHAQASLVSGEGKRKLHTEKARNYYEKALELSPGDTEIRNKLALTFVSSENPMTGIQMLRDILEEEPENQEAIYNLGVLSIQSGQWEKAEERFRTLLSINPEHAGGNFYLGVVMANKGNNTEARKYFEKAKDLNPDPGFRKSVDQYIDQL